VDSRWTLPAEHCISSKLIATIFIPLLASYNINKHYFKKQQKTADFHSNDNNKKSNQYLHYII